MSTVPTLRAAPNGTIYMHWTDASPRGKRGRSRRQSTGTDDMAAAKIYLGEWLLMERSQPAPDKVLTVADLWSVYAAKHVETKVLDGGHRHGQAWKNLQPHFGLLTPSDVSEDVVAKYGKLRTTGALGPLATGPTVRLELSLLLACFNWCASPKRRPPLISKAAVPSIELPPAAEPRDRWLTESEMKDLFAAAVDMRRHGRLSRGERFLWLALETGSRKTAILELTWDRVDFSTGVIHYAVPGRRMTKKRRAAVPISQRLRPVVERMWNEREGDLVMDNDADVDVILNRIAANAGVEGLTPHVLRHTAATHMARRGVSLWIIAKILGNTVAMVERVYAKHSPEDLRAAVDAISGGAQLRANGAQSV